MKVRGAEPRLTRPRAGLCGPVTRAPRGKRTGRCFARQAHIWGLQPGGSECADPARKQASVGERLVEGYLDDPRLVADDAEVVVAGEDQRPSVDHRHAFDLGRHVLERVAVEDEVLAERLDAGL